ncbi:hypothetical protein I4F81_005914 [Pyropia yezoensis]|uniref:Uncharacterized protein n=1 Tax=Pyropia yezoensis TaxID=2788 RepID=A0ACC3BZB5_PYRYE|nr:hypothetical protein I4F81_005914 [Neopyropia yezoensis]
MPGTVPETQTVAATLRAVMAGHQAPRGGEEGEQKGPAEEAGGGPTESLAGAVPASKYTRRRLRRKRARSNAAAAVALGPRPTAHPELAVVPSLAAAWQGTPAVLGTVLRDDGSGWAVLRDVVPAAAVSPRDRNSDRESDDKRKQVLLFGRAPGVADIKGAQRRVAGVSSSALGTTYAPSPPKVLVSEPGARQQLPHADASQELIGGNPPGMVSVLLAVEGATTIIIYPYTRAVGPRLGASSDDEAAPRGATGAAPDGGVGAAASGAARAHRLLRITPSAAPVVVVIPMGGCVIFRGDLVHCGVSNPSGSTHLRVHWYVYRADLAHVPWGDHTQYVSFAPAPRATRSPQALVRKKNS